MTISQSIHSRIKKVPHKKYLEEESHASKQLNKMFLEGIRTKIQSDVLEAKRLYNECMNRHLNN